MASDRSPLAHLGQLYDTLTTDERVDFLVLFFEAHLEEEKGDCVVRYWGLHKKTQA